MHEMEPRASDTACEEHMMETDCTVCEGLISAAWRVEDCASV